MIDTILFGIVFTIGWFCGHIEMSPFIIVESIICFFITQYLVNNFYEKK